MSEILQVILMPARKQTFLLFMLRMDLVIFRIHQDRLAQSGNFLLFLDCRFSLFMFLVQDYIAVFSIIQHQQSLPPVVSFHTHDNIKRSESDNHIFYHSLIFYIEFFPVDFSFSLFHILFIKFTHHIIPLRCLLYVNHLSLS